MKNTHTRSRAGLIRRGSRTKRERTGLVADEFLKLAFQFLKEQRFREVSRSLGIEAI